jgi:hypothetical protein
MGERPVGQAAVGERHGQFEDDLWGAPHEALLPATVEQPGGMAVESGRALVLVAGKKGGVL